MFASVSKSIKSVNYKMLVSLIFLGLCPTVYTTVRIFFLGQLPGDGAYSIAGQLGWVNLLYEILSEAVILPLFYFVGKKINERDELTNRVKTGLLVTFCVFGMLSLIVSVFTYPMLKLMAADESIIAQSATYIRIESVANIISMLSNFGLVVLITLNKEKYLYALTAGKVIMCLISDTFLVSALPVSANMGVNGIGVSNILVNTILFFITVAILHKENVKVFSAGKLSFGWLKEFGTVGGISGLESLIRNLAYMLMIVRMVNVVNEQGTYWVANNFIWGWLLLPVTQLAELIKSDMSTDKNAIYQKSPAYFVITAAVCALWCASIPLWKPFMTYVLQYEEVEKLFSLVLLLLGFYMLYAFQNVFDATFYGLGKTQYMVFESIVTNCVYYGGAFILYVMGVWTPTLSGIALLFGIGVAFDSLVSLVAYIYLLNKLKNIRIDSAQN